VDELLQLRMNSEFFTNCQQKLIQQEASLFPRMRKDDPGLLRNFEV